MSIRKTTQSSLVALALTLSPGCSALNKSSSLPIGEFCINGANIFKANINGDENKDCIIVGPESIDYHEGIATSPDRYKLKQTIHKREDLSSPHLYTIPSYEDFNIIGIEDRDNNGLYETLSLEDETKKVRNLTFVYNPKKGRFFDQSQ